MVSVPVVRAQSLPHPSDEEIEPRTMSSQPLVILQNGEHSGITQQ